MIRQIITCCKSLLVIVLFSLLGCGSDGSSQNLAPVTPGGSSGGATGAITIASTALAQGASTAVSVTFTYADGSPASGVSVDFTTTLGSISPATVVTDGQGAASATLQAGTTAGTGQVTASATYSGKTYVKSANFQVNLPPLHLSAITLGAETLSYGGTTSVSVSVFDANNAVYTGQELDVLFTSVAAGSNAASISSPVRTVNGVATTTYTAKTVTGTDTITATISGSSVTKTLSVTPLSAGSITFISATPTNLALKGTGGIGKSEVSTVVFRVLDSSGAVRPNTTVDFSLNTTVGGISLSSTSGSTGTDGTVAVQVNSGIIATTVRVTATVRGTTISTQSEQLVVSTGLPAQDGFSISIETLNAEAWSIDGVEDKVTARLSDHFHNPVPDGTAVYFTTSGGSIQPSCTTVGGACTVTWTSQNPRPATGRARILAYAIGEEAFVDANGNGLADAVEFTDDPEAHRDDNESSNRDSGEPFVDFNGDGTFNTGDGKYNGVLQGAEYAGAPKSKHVFSNTTLVMGTSAANILSNPALFTVPLSGSAAVTITVRDLNGNNMPTGSTVEFKLTTTIKGTTVAGIITTETTLSMPTYDKYTFPNTSVMGGVAFTLTVSDPSLTTSASGVLEVIVTSPKGVVTKSSIPIN